MCSMCEAHINEAIRKAVPAEKIQSSHRKGEAVILSREPIDEEAVRKAIDDTGYIVLSVRSEPYKKRFFFFNK